MKKVFTTLIMLAIAALISAQTAIGSDINVTKAGCHKDGGKVSTSISIDISKARPGANEAIIIIPGLTAPGHSATLPAAGIYSRNRYYHHMRNNGGIMITGRDEQSYRAKQHPSQITLTADIPYEEWMEEATLGITVQTCGCCGSILSEEHASLASIPHYTPTYIYITPKAEEVKVRELSGRAFIDFVVNKTDIREDYRGNASELTKIRATIDSVRNDKDITVKSLSLKGYASPEGRYESNARLAEGRTKALKEYVNSLYHFEKGFISADFQPEDWEGYRHMVEESSLPHKAEILALMDRTDLAPDPLEWKIKSTYPGDYKVILKDFFPALRHTDYAIHFEIRSFTDPEEIKQMALKSPSKLSLNEFYAASQACEKGSKEFVSLFRTAAAMYPHSHVANLNAASAALQRGDIKGADEYLENAGHSPEAEYTRGVRAALTQNYNEALKYMEKAAAEGINEASEAIMQIKKIININN